MRQRGKFFIRASRMVWLSAAFLSGAAFAADEATQAAVFAESPFSLHGFGTLGVARSTNGGASYLRDVSQPKGIENAWSGRADSVLGVQASYRINDLAEAVVQGVSRYRYDGSYSPEISWAFLKYDVSPRLSLRVGRIGTEFLIQSDSRMVGYSYLPVRPAVDFFGIVPFNYGDGIDARVRWPLGDGVVRADVFAGVAREALPPYDLDGSPVMKGSLGYDSGPWQFRYIYAQAKLANNIERLEPLQSMLAAVGAQSTAKALELDGNVSRYHSIGLSYDDGDWQAQAALSTIRNETVMFENMRSGYFLLGRRIGSVSPFVGYSWTKSSKKSLETGLPDAYFSPLNTAVTTVLGQSHIDRHTVSLGARWDVYRNIDLKAQVDFVRGDKSSVLLLEDIKPGWDGHTTIFSLSMDFVF